MKHLRIPSRNSRKKKNPFFFSLSRLLPHPLLLLSSFFSFSPSIYYSFLSHSRPSCTQSLLISLSHSLSHSLLLYPSPTLFSSQFSTALPFHQTFNFTLSSTQPPPAFPQVYEVSTKKGSLEVSETLTDYNFALLLGMLARVPREV